MHTETETAVARLLEETLAAHSVYETTVLGGVYDERWPDWYATHLIELGLADLLPHAGKIDVARLGPILTQLDADYRREQPEGDWPAYYAKRLGGMAD